MTTNSETIDDLLTRVCEIFAETEDEVEFRLLCDQLLETHSATTKEAVFDRFGRMFDTDPVLD